MPLPLPLMPWAGFGADSVNGAFPNTNGLVYFYAAGLAPSLKDTYTGNSTSDPVHANPIQLDADGRPPSQVFLNGAYTVDVRDEDDVSLYTLDYVADVGSLLAIMLGPLLAQGAKDVTLPYTALSTDNCITVDDLDVVGSNGVLTLPSVLTRQMPLIILNYSDAAGGGKIVRVTPLGGQSIQSNIQTTTYFEIDPATTLVYWAILLPDAANTNWICLSNMVV